METVKVVYESIEFIHIGLRKTLEVIELMLAVLASNPRTGEVLFKLNEMMFIFVNRFLKTL